MQTSKYIPKKRTKNEANLCPPSRTSWYCNVYIPSDYLKLVEEAKLESVSKKAAEKAQKSQRSKFLDNCQMLPAIMRKANCQLAMSQTLPWPRPPTNNLKRANEKWQWFAQQRMSAQLIATISLQERKTILKYSHYYVQLALDNLPTLSIYSAIVGQTWEK